MNPLPAAAWPCHEVLLMLTLHWFILHWLLLLPNYDASYAQMNLEYHMFLFYRKSLPEYFESKKCKKLHLMLKVKIRKAVLKRKKIYS